MNFLRNLDLYKVIVLLSFVVLPLGGWWCYTQDQSIIACDKAIRDATRPGGLLEQIGNLQKKVEVVVQNRRLTSDAINIPRSYFEGQIMAAGPQLKTDDFGLSEPKSESASLGGSRQRADDFVVDVTWPRKDFAVQLDFIYAVLFNCESGARNVGEQTGRQSIWKLRELQIENATDESLTRGHKTPPPELADKWTIRTMKFARREPRKGS